MAAGPPASSQPGSQVGQATQGYQDLPEFAHEVSQATGVDPRVIFAQAMLEGAYAPNGTGHFNYLNIRPYPGDRYSAVSSGNFEEFANVHDAAWSTARRIRQPFLWGSGPGEGGLGAVIAAHGSPAQEIAAIGRSGWDAGHYGGGGSALESKFESLYGASAAQGPPRTSKTALAPGGSTGTTVTGSLGHVVDATGVGGALKGVERIGAFVTSVRLPELLGGIVLVSIGLFILARALLSTEPVKLAGQTVGNFQGAKDEGASNTQALKAVASAPLAATPAGRARSAARGAGGRAARARRVSREGTGRPRRVESFASPMGERSVQARARRAASTARRNGGGPGELPADY